jgi:hypothetical protein
VAVLVVEVQLLLELVARVEEQEVVLVVLEPQDKVLQVATMLPQVELVAAVGLVRWVKMETALKVAMAVLA